MEAEAGSVVLVEQAAMSSAVAHSKRFRVCMRQSVHPRDGAAYFVIVGV